MLEYLGYGLFVICMIGCLSFIASSLESEDASTLKRNDPKR